jgi:hypothetical protein
MANIYLEKANGKWLNSRAEGKRQKMLRNRPEANRLRAEGNSKRAEG